MPLEHAAQLLEAVMLVCFGFSWPLSIAKSLRTRFVRGKSAFFMWILFTGYIFGITSKVSEAVELGQAPIWLTWLYLTNLLLVGTDLALYYKFHHNLQPVAKELAHEIAETEAQAKSDAGEGA